MHYLWIDESGDALLKCFLYFHFGHLGFFVFLCCQLDLFITSGKKKYLWIQNKFPNFRNPTKRRSVFRSRCYFLLGFSGSWFELCLGDQFLENILACRYQVDTLLKARPSHFGIVVWCCNTLPSFHVLICMYTDRFNWTWAQPMNTLFSPNVAKESNLMQLDGCCLLETSVYIYI